LELGGIWVTARMRGRCPSTEEARAQSGRLEKKQNVFADSLPWTSTGSRSSTPRASSASGARRTAALLVGRLEEQRQDLFTVARTAVGVMDSSVRKVHRVAEMA